MTAALGDLAASLGKRTLLVEVDARGNLTDFFEHDRVGYVPEEIRPNLYCMTMNTEDSLEEYLTIFLKMGRVSRLSILSRIFDFIANAAPGVKEILTIGKIAYEATLMQGGSRKWDLIIIDAAPTGRIVGQLDAPAAINELFEVGMVREQTDWMREILADPRITALAIVATPEEMPVTESIELYQTTRTLDVSLQAVFVNRVLPELFTTTEEETFENMRQPEPARLIQDSVQGEIDPVFEAARLAVKLRRSRVEHIRRLRTEIPVPTIFVPYLFVRDHGQRSTRLVAQAIREEMGL